MEKGIRTPRLSNLFCPVCQLTLRPGELEAHFKYEWEKLSNHSSTLKSFLKNCNHSGTSNGSTPSQSSTFLGPSEEQWDGMDVGEPSCSSSGLAEDVAQPCSSGVSSSLLNGGPSTSSQREKKSLYSPPGQETYKRVRVNRLFRRQCQRWKVQGVGDEVTCPVCCEPVLAEGPEDLQRHVDKCLRKQEGGSSSDEDVDVEGDEYEWCGIRKVRITSLLRAQGQLEALGTRVRKGDEDAIVDVCVDDDEDDDYGPPQYSHIDLTLPDRDTEADPNLGSAQRQQDATNCDGKYFRPIECLDQSSSYNGDPFGMRELREPRQNISPPNLHHSFPQNCDSERETSHNSVEEPRTYKNPAEESSSHNLGTGIPQNPVVEALESKIRDLQEKGNIICHICHGAYEVPLTSTVCWHVHCERCWLQALASQKLCPQCKAIVSPTELRKIYL